MTIREDLATRIRAIQHDGPAPAQALRTLWPHRIPTLTHNHPLTERQLHALDLLLDCIERKIPR